MSSKPASDDHSANERLRTLVSGLHLLREYASTHVFVICWKWGPVFADIIMQGAVLHTYSNIQDNAEYARKKSSTP